MASGVSDLWPRLDYAKDRGTFETLHLMSQVVGKARTACAPWVNHGWQVALYVSPRGFTTSAVPHGQDLFDLEFDFLDHALRCRASNGFAEAIPLAGQTIAAFYDGVSGLLEQAGLPVRIDGRPNEIAGAVPFRSDVAARPYDPDAAFRLWRALIQIAQVFEAFRTGFLGKISPVHLFWGSFDLAVTRFSGRRAPLHPGGCRTFPTPSRAKPIRTRSPAPASGPAAAWWTIRPSIPTPIRSRTASARAPWNPRPRSSMRGWESSSSPTTRCALRPTRPAP